MHNEKAEDFISMAEEDKLVMEESRHFGFRTANSACFHAQQYAEKMIKARLIIMGFQIVRTHNLIFLLARYSTVMRPEPDIPWKGRWIVRPKRRKKPVKWLWRSLISSVFMKRNVPTDR